MRWKLLFAIGLSLGPVVAQAQIPEQAGAQDNEPEPPPKPPKITSVRYKEDYSYLRDPENRSGAWWEPLKYIPIAADGEFYLTLGDEIRLRFELLVHNRFELGAKPVDPYFRYRQLPYGDLHLGEHARTFLQFMITEAIRSPETKTAFIDQSGVEVLQGFVEGTETIAGDHRLLLRLGRWSMSYGGQRLVSTGPNVRTSFEGALARWQHDRWRLDTFFVWPIQPRFGSFNDDIDRSRRLWSAYLIRQVPEFGRGSTVELYYFGFANDAAHFEEGSGRERRQTLGIRFAGGQPGGWQWDLETMQQFGTFASGDIHAWTVASAHRVGFEHLPLQPQFELRANAISGDARAGDGRLGTFNPLFTTAEYFGDVAAIGPANLLNFRAIATANLGAGVAVNGVVEPYWRQRAGDALYDPGLNVIRPSDDSRVHFVGTQLEAQVAWVVSRNVSTRLEYTTIVPDGFIAETGPALSIQYALLEFDFKY